MSGARRRSSSFSVPPPPANPRWESRSPKNLDGEILVCDSTQVYRHFDIGTGKSSARRAAGHPPPPRRSGRADRNFHRRRISPPRPRSSGRSAPPQQTSHHHRRHRPLSARPARRSRGRARTLRRIARPPARTAPNFAAPPHLHRLLVASRSRIRRAHRPPRHAKNHSRDRNAPDGRETRRRNSSRRPHAARRLPHHENRPRLRRAQRSTQRIHSRIDAMIQAAGSKKCAARSTAAFPPTPSPFNLSATPIGATSSTENSPDKKRIEKIQQATRRFAKRQLTWFRREPDVHWLAGFGDSPEISRAAFEILNPQIS